MSRAERKTKVDRCHALPISRGQLPACEGLNDERGGAPYHWPN